MRATVLLRLRYSPAAVCLTGLAAVSSGLLVGSGVGSLECLEAEIAAQSRTPRLRVCWI